MESGGISKNRLNGGIFDWMVESGEFDWTVESDGIKTNCGYYSQKIYIIKFWHFFGLKNPQNIWPLYG